MDFTPTKKRYYIGPMEFDANRKFVAANFADGRFYLVGEGEKKELVAEYQHKDHLGNVRVAFTDRNGDKRVQLLDGAAGPSEVTQINDYFPFGLQFPKACGAVVVPENRYQYNGKEWEEEFGLYDYGARYYDPAIGRWGAVDPLADQYASLSSYNYVANNPIISIDPDGARIILVNNRRAALRNLAKVTAFERGANLLQRLIKSRNTYRIHTTFWTRSSAYDPYGTEGPSRTVYSVGDSWRSRVGGGAISGAYALYHELGHAGQHESNRNMRDNKSLERDNVPQVNHMRAVFGEEDMRTTYGGLGLSFNSDPSHYNKGNVAIENFKELEYIDHANGGDYQFFRYDYSEGGGASKTRYGLILADENGEVNHIKLNNADAYKFLLDWLSRTSNDNE